MKKFLFSLFVILCMVSLLPQDAKAYGEPKIAYDKFKAYIDKEKAIQSDTYKTFYFFAPFQGAQGTPVMFLISYDSENRKIKATHLGLSYKEGGKLILFAQPIDLGYSDVEILTLGDDVYFLTDLNDGRGRIGLRIPSVAKDPIDRGPIQKYQNVLQEYGKQPTISPVNNYSLLNEAFSEWM